MTRATKPISAVILSILALAGAIVSVILTQHFYDLRSGAAGFKSFCNVSATFNCDVIAASPFAELFAGLPLSSFGTAWYVALFIVSLFILNKDWRREATRAAFVMTSFGLIWSLAYLAIMAVVIKTFCLLCLVVDAVALGAWICVLSLKPERLKKRSPDFGQWKTMAGTAAAGMLLTILALRGMDTSTVKSGDIQDMVDIVMNTPVVAVNAGEEFPSIGPKTAPVTIVEFSDFQCPYCRLGAVLMNSLVNRYPGKVRVVFRNFPLDPSCNRIVQHSMHPYACEAAKLAHCAHKQGKFEPVYESYFENQSKFGPGALLELAGKAGAQTDQLQGCANASETNLAISRDVEEANQLGVKSTPTFFFNGRKIEGLMALPVWSRLIEKAL